MANDIIDITVGTITDNVEITINPNLTTVNINQVIGVVNPVTSVNGRIGDVIGLAEQSYVIAQDLLKVDKITGKGLSTNDYTTTEKNKLAGISEGAEVNVNADWNATSGDALILNKPVIPITTNFVPYTGAISDVNLGEFGVQLGNLEFDLTPTNAPTNVGSLSWNDTDGTLDLKLKGGNTTLQLGQETVARIVNKTATNITLLEANYQAVRVTGAQGQRPKVDLALANNDANSASTLGLVTETILNNEEGFITTSGQVKQINTTGSLQGETWLDGDVLYLSGTVAGRLTNIKPIAPIHTVIIGFVEYAHAINGKIFVKVDNGYELEELHNVSAIAPNNNEILAYDLATTLWKPKSVITALGYTPYNATNPNNYTSNLGTVTSVSALTLGTSGTDVSSSVANSSTTPVITLNIPTASALNRGALSSSDWTNFNNKQNTITPSALTKVDDTNVTLTLGGSPNNALLEGVSLTLGWTGTLADSRIASASTWNAKQNALSGTGFVKSILGVISYDTNTYITGNQSISLSGAITGSGTTSIVTTLANNIVGISNLTATGTPSATTYLRGDNTWATVSASGSMAIGGTITSATSGSILFAGISGVLQQDNSNLFWDDINNRLGIGKNSLSANLDVVGNFNLRNIDGLGGTGYAVEFDTNSSTPRMDFIVNGLYIGQISSAGNDAIYKNNRNGGSLLFMTNNSVNATEKVRIDSSGNLGIGINAPTEKLHINGNLRLTGSFKDSNNLSGTSGQVLSSTGTGTSWITNGGGGSSGFIAAHSFVKLSSGQSTTVATGGFTTSGAAEVQNRVLVTPYIPANNITTQSFSINVSVAAVGLSKIIVFSDLNGKPDTKLYESANLDCSTTGTKTATVVFNFIAGTTYWIGLHSSSTQTLNVIRTVVIPISTVGLTSYFSYSATVAFGTLGSTIIPAPVLSTTTAQAPFISINV